MITIFPSVLYYRGRASTRHLYLIFRIGIVIIILYSQRERKKKKDDLMEKRKWKVLIVEDGYRIGMLIKHLIRWDEFHMECADVVDN